MLKPTLNLKKLGIISALTAGLLISGSVKADHERDYLLLAAPLILHSLFHNHSYVKHNRIQRHSRHHSRHNSHHNGYRKPHRQSHSKGRYSRNNSPRRHRH